MSRFVIVSFAFMGWGFYEISGGRDFVAPERPVEIASSTAALPAASAGESTDKFRRSAKVRADSLVTPQVLQAATRRPLVEARTPSEPRPAADPTHRRTVALAQIASAAGALQTTDTAFGIAAETGTLHLDTLEGGLAAMTTQFAEETLALNANLTEAEPQPSPESYLDIREIRASRVNMRQGPGTIYPVMARLLAGDEVLIMEDNGTGWLHLRTRSGDKIGWVAASLVSKKRS
ncbi:SH3 domain-containing protein [Pseudophaeobacter sp.]|uniref:SH3 domain-containing protein n=1 Tax=Pseudophaeobacter sp. TaxID=1971739 RepID=UPI0032975809